MIWDEHNKVALGDFAGRRPMPLCLSGGRAWCLGMLGVVPHSPSRADAGHSRSGLHFNY